MQPLLPPVPELERQLLRKSIVKLTAGRARCTDCDRTPLVGECLHVYERGGTVCELCRARRREAPVRSEPVRGVEHGQTVRLHRAA